jgi:hypothetical protein
MCAVVKRYRTFLKNEVSSALKEGKIHPVDIAQETFLSSKGGGVFSTPASRIGSTGSSATTAGASAIGTGEGLNW